MIAISDLYVAVSRQLSQLPCNQTSKLVPLLRL